MGHVESSVPSVAGPPVGQFPAEHVPATWQVLAAQVTGVPTHTPALQVSYSVQAFPSLQLPVFLAGFEQSPVVVSQVPALWHWSGSGQVPATQVPVGGEQVAHPEHALPVFCQVPFASQVCGWEPLQRF